MPSAPITSTITPHQTARVDVHRGTELMATATYDRNERRWTCRLFPERAHYINMTMSLSGDSQEVANILEAIAKSYKHPPKPEPVKHPPFFNTTFPPSRSKRVSRAKR